MAAAMGDSIQRYPLLRLFFAYLCGLGLAHAAYPHVALLGAMALGGTTLLLLLLITCVGRRGLPYGIVASLLFLMLGVCGYARARTAAGHVWPSQDVCYEARVVSEPRQRERSILCEVEVTAMRDSSVWHHVGHKKVFAYLEPCDEARALLPGDVLCFRGEVRAPHNFSDSLTFDYARHVTMQGAAGTIYLPHARWTKVGVVRLSLRERMLRLRHRLKTDYLATAFEGDALGVLAAMTLGDRQSLSQEVRAAYSDAGAAHALALSGLHVGVIYGMLAFVMRGLLRRRSVRWVRELLTMVALWLFALLVGMPASVVRAVSMCTLYILARWVSDGSASPLHVLSLTALLMLLLRPLWLFDVGFQLSFMAMASILCVEPHLEMLLQRHGLHPVLGYLVSLLGMSLAAQLGTAPLVLYHFGTFPTYFLLTNVVVVPGLSLLLIASLVWWALLLVGIPWAVPFGRLLQYLVGWLNGALCGIGQWPGAVLHVEGFGLLPLLFAYGFILSAGLLVLKKKKRGAMLSLASLLGLLSTLLLKP